MSAASKSTRENVPVKGDQYTFVALAASTKAIIAYRIGKRDSENDAGLGNVAFGTIAVAIFLGAMGMFAGIAALYLTRQPPLSENRPASARKNEIRTAGESN